LLFATPSAAATDIHKELDRNQKQQQALQRSQKALNIRLGTLAKQTQQLDQALLAALDQLHKSQLKLRKLDRMLRKLENERATLTQHIHDLQEEIAGEATAAWMHAGRKISWLDVLAGVPIEEIPHRKHIIELLMAAHEEKKTALRAAVRRLSTLTQKVSRQRHALALLRSKQQEQKRDLRNKQRQKRAVLRSLRRKQRHGDRRMHLLQAREKSLKLLLVRLKRRAQMASLAKLRRVSVRAHRGKLPWPMKYGRVVANFGTRQSIGGRIRGVRIRPSLHHFKVEAIAAGQVKFAGWFGGYGLMMVVDHGEGIITIYAHNRLLYHQAGDWVEQGELLAEAGSTGWVEKMELYFELRDRGKPVNPRRWCRRH